MYPRIPWEPVANPMGSAECTLGTSVLIICARSSDVHIWITLITCGLVYRESKDVDAAIELLIGPNEMRKHV